jgi:hypothetical protein
MMDMGGMDMEGTGLGCYKAAVAGCHMEVLIPNSGSSLRWILNIELGMPVPPQNGDVVPLALSFLRRSFAPELRDCEAPLGDELFPICSHSSSKSDTCCEEALLR